MKDLTKKTMENIEKLKQQEIANRIILLTYGGSISYGTNNENSDIDLRGVYLPTKRQLLTMDVDKKPYEDRITDTVVYPLQQNITLLTSCNPNVLEVFGTKDEHIFMLTKEGKLLRDNIDLFLTTKAYNTFVGYSTAQLRRLQNALARGYYPQIEKEKHIKESIETKMLSFSDRYKELDKDIILELLDSDKSDFEKEIFISMVINKYPIRDLKGMLEEMLLIIKDFDKLNCRNTKKDELHLRKHAMHLVRLLLMGKEILEGKGVHTYREDSPFLLKIRRGEIDYPEVFEISNKLKEELVYARKHTTLPIHVDEKKVADLTYEINKVVLEKF